MAFTREQLAEFEKKPQTQVSDKVSPFTGKEETAAAPADETQDPPADESAVVTVDDDDDTDLETTPSGDETETAPDGQGDGTSDVIETEESSTSTTATPSGETETDGGARTEGSTTQPPPKKGSARERIQELILERDGLRAYGSYSQEQLAAKDKEIEELRQKIAAGTTARTVTQDEPAPVMGDPQIGYDPDKFQAATLAWAKRQAEKAAKAATPTAPTLTPEAKKILDAFAARAAKFAETHPDYVEAVAALPQWKQKTAKVLITADDGPDLLHWLGTHKAEAVRIARLSEEDQLLELGSIRKDVKRGTTVIPPKKETPEPGASKTPAPKKSPSSAPPPPTRLPAGNRSQARDIQDPGLSMDEFVRRDREERLAQKARSRKLRGLS
jgi:hypothetical protein